MKHTKGEWKCSGVGNFSGTLVSFIKSGELQIAQTRGDTEEGRTFEEVTANAKLIAAAPELLEALQGVLNLIDEGILVRDISKDNDYSYFLKQGIEINNVIVLMNEVINKTK